MQSLTEGTTRFLTQSEEHISKRMPVFYNPVMKLNRDLSLLAIATLHDPIIALPMEASGVRAARIVHELVEPGHLAVREIAINDLSQQAIETARRNVRHPAATFSVADASVFLRTRRPADYVDVDPFGTPNPFLDAAVRGVRRGGILAITATDTSALAGTYPRACARKYWAQPSRTWVMHDIGLRILVRKAQLVGAQYDVALAPLLSVSTDHYYRIFLRCAEGAGRARELIARHAYAHVDTARACVEVSSRNVAEGARAHAAGPLWTGPLHDAAFVRAMLERSEALDDATFSHARDLLRTVEDECRIESVGFLDMHELSSRIGCDPPRRDALFALLGDRACRTHISPVGFKTDLPMEDVEHAMRDAQGKK